MVTVPPSDYSQLESDEAEVWKITTEDGKVFIAKEFLVTDSTLVIQELDFEGKNRSKIAQRETEEQLDLPISIERDNLASLEKQKTEYVEPILIIGIPALVVVLVLVGYAVGNLAPVGR